MPMPDARTRSKISLTPSKVLSPSLPKKALPRILLANVLYVLALKGTKEYLLDLEVGVMWVLLRVLACGGFAVLVWEAVTKQVAKRRSIEWSALALASFLLFVEYGSLLVALYRLPSTSVILFAHFSTYWITAFTRYTSAPKTLSILAALAISVLSDTHNLPRLLPGYGALVLHAVSSLAADHTISVLTPSLGSTFTISAATLGASLFAIPFYLFRSIMLNFPPSPSLPLASLVIIPLTAYAVLFMTPLTAHSFDYTNLAAPVFAVSFPTLAVLSGLFGALAFSHLPRWSELAVAAFLFYGVSPESIEATPITPRAPTSRLIKSYLKSILSNPESRKIFYFLMLNLSYMLVQMLYGVWTNSLGLISDAIHMAFDCMAIGVGLLASVMATWEPNDRFTYGYGRIETLSGFANGIFLILISIFIVFEAIQRILDPPEMSTNQLLLVSSVGLGVNLFGMFAMGGHHHGGGGHSHSHGHSHSLSALWGGGGHSDHGEETHGHSHDHDHSHSHPSNALPATPAAACDDHSHSPKQNRSHSHSHSHPSHEDCEEGHGHSHSPHAAKSDSHSPVAGSHHGHSHSANERYGHSHDADAHSLSPSSPHSHSHSHSPPPPATDGHAAVGHSRSFSGSNSDVKVLAQRRHSRASSLAIQINNPTPNAIPVSYPSPVIQIHAPDSDHEHHGHSHDQQQHHDRHDNCSTPGHGHSHVPKYHDDDHGHGHEGHSHGHGETVKSARPPSTPSHAHSHGHSHNMRGVFLHVMADTLGSVGVIISTLLIQFYGWTGFDPIASLFIAILIAASVFPLVIDTGKILALDVAEKDREIQEAVEELSTIEGLASYSCPRFWPKDASTVVGSIHIQLAPSASSSDPTGPHSSVRTTYARADRVAERVDELLRKRIEGLEELTVQVEGRPVNAGHGGGGAGMAQRGYL